MVLLNLFHSKQRKIQKGILTIGMLFFGELAFADSLSFLNPFQLPNTPQTFYVNTQTLLMNDAFSIDGLFHDFEGRFYSQKSDYLAVEDRRYDIGTYINGLGYLGLTYRQEAVMRTSADTMILVNQSSNDLDMTLDKNYNIALTIEGFEVYGITLANTLNLYKDKEYSVKLGFAVELLYGTQTQDGNVNGNATALSEKDYDFMFSSTYRYTENHLYDLEVNPATSYGFSTHLSLLAQYRKFSLLIVGNDIFAKLYWKNLPYSYVTMTSDNKSYDENGYVEYSPVISGLEKEVTFTQTLMDKWKVEGSYALDENTMHLGVEYIYDTYLPYVKYTYVYNENLVGSLSYETYFGMFGVDIHYKAYHFALHSNGFSDTSALKFDIGWNY